MPEEKPISPIAKLRGSRAALSEVISRNEELEQRIKTATDEIAKIANNVTGVHIQRPRFSRIFMGEKDLYPPLSSALIAFCKYLETGEKQ